jgi:hypothetical protein
MATIIKTAAGTYKAVLRDHTGAYLKSKCFTRRSDARDWAKAQESDHERMEALGCPGAAISVSHLIDTYMAQYSGRSRSITSRVEWWRARLGSKRLIDVSVQDVRAALDEYAAGKALRLTPSDN